MPFFVAVKHKPTGPVELRPCEPMAVLPLIRARYVIFHEDEVEALKGMRNALVMGAYRDDRIPSDR